MPEDTAPQGASRVHAQVTTPAGQVAADRLRAKAPAEGPMPTDGSDVPEVLFVCVSNRGKSVMAEGLARTIAGCALSVSSAGTEARLGATANELSAQVLAEVGADITDHHPRQLTDELMVAADVTVVLGTTAQVNAPDGAIVEVWETDEPSLRGIGGVERMRLIRDDIAERVTDLARRLSPP